MVDDWRATQIEQLRRGLFQNRLEPGPAVRSHELSFNRSNRNQPDERQRFREAGERREFTEERGRVSTIQGFHLRPSEERTPWADDLAPRWGRMQIECVVRDVRKHGERAKRVEEGVHTGNQELHSDVGTSALAKDVSTEPKCGEGRSARDRAVSKTNSMDARAELYTPLDLSEVFLEVVDKGW